MFEPDRPPFTARLGAVASALAAWLRAAALRRPARPSAAAGDALIYNNRNDGPPDLDELWVEEIRKDGEAKGMTEEQTQRRIGDVLGAVTKTVNQDGLDLTTPEGQAAAKANIAKLKPEDQALAQKALDGYTAVYQGHAADKKAAAAADPEASDPAKHQNVTGANANIAAGTQHIRSAGGPALAHEAEVKTAAAYSAAAAQTNDVTGNLRTVGADYVAASGERDAAIVKAQVKAEMVDGGFGADEPAAPPVASAAPKLTIDGRPLAAAGQLAPDSGTYVAKAPEAANDPAAPEQRKVAPTSPGLTA